MGSQVRLLFHAVLICGILNRCAGRVIGEVVEFLAGQGIGNLQQLGGLHPDDLEWPKGTQAGKKALVRSAYKRIKDSHQAAKKGLDGEAGSGAAVDERLPICMVTVWVCVVRCAVAGCRPCC